MAWPHTGCSESLCEQQGNWVLYKISPEDTLLYRTAACPWCFAVTLTQLWLLLNTTCGRRSELACPCRDASPGVIVNRLHWAWLPPALKCACVPSCQATGFHATEKNNMGDFRRFKLSTPALDYALVTDTLHGPCKGFMASTTSSKSAGFSLLSEVLPLFPTSVFINSSNVCEGQQTAHPVVTHVPSCSTSVTNAFVRSHTNFCSAALIGAITFIIVMRAALHPLKK